jgi:hypothetical protein
MELAGSLKVAFAESVKVEVEFAWWSTMTLSVTVRVTFGVKLGVNIVFQERTDAYA